MKKVANIEEIVQHWRKNPESTATLTATLELKVPDCCDKLEEFLSDYVVIMRRIYLTYGRKCFSNMLLRVQTYPDNGQSSNQER